MIKFFSYSACPKKYNINQGIRLNVFCSKEWPLLILMLKLAIVFVIVTIYSLFMY